MGLFSYRTDETLLKDVTGLIAEGISGRRSLFMGFLTSIPSKDGKTLAKLLNCRGSMEEFKNLSDESISPEAHPHPSSNRYVPCENPKCHSMACIDCSSEDSICVTYECPLKFCTDDPHEVSEKGKKTLEVITTEDDDRISEEKKRKRLEKSDDLDPPNPSRKEPDRGEDTKSKTNRRRGRPRKVSKGKINESAYDGTEKPKSKTRNGSGRPSNIPDRANARCAICGTDKSCKWRFHEITGTMCNKCGCQRMGLGTFIDRSKKKRNDWLREVARTEGKSKDLPRRLEIPDESEHESEPASVPYVDQMESISDHGFSETTDHSSDRENPVMTMEAIPLFQQQEQPVEDVFREVFRYSEESNPSDSILGLDYSTMSGSSSEDLSDPFVYFVDRPSISSSESINHLDDDLKCPGTPTSRDLECWLLSLDSTTYENPYLHQ